MSTHSTTHPPGARALYLAGSSHKRVSHTHEALVVTNAAGQTLRYPLARLARIVSSPAVDWNGAALSLCLQHGISITWADGKGQPLGSACPTPVSPLLWEMAKREWAYLRNPAAHIHLPQPLQTLMHAWVVAQLLAHPLPSQLWDDQGNTIPLAQDLTELFERWHTPNGAALHQHIGALLRVAKSSQYP